MLPAVSMPVNGRSKADCLFQRAETLSVALAVPWLEHAVPVDRHFRAMKRVVFIPVPQKNTWLERSYKSI